ncbi:MAG: SAM-dependent methyltransferase, partial [Planctomycetota bacterium]
MTVGVVTLVGAGPGDPELLTLRGARAIAEADVLVVDRLVDPGVLTHARTDAVVIDAGKRPERHHLTQGEINATLVEHALRGVNVVRVKGGDPFVYGRGMEEAEACRSAGIEVRVTPG